MKADKTPWNFRGKEAAGAETEKPAKLETKREKHAPTGAKRKQIKPKIKPARGHPFYLCFVISKTAYRESRIANKRGTRSGSG